MALESFYGGKQGISPVIKKHYSSINQMRTDFETNKTQDVWFGELAIINTESKSSPDNGKLFRRVLKVTSGQENFNAGTQAEYIGQIVGPPGETPFIAFDSLENIKEKISNENSINVAFVTENGIIETEKTNVDNLVYISSGAIESVSGEDNSEIKYTWANVRLSNDDYAYIYLGFQIPSPYFNIQNVISTSYTSTPSIELSQNTITDPQTQEEKIDNHFYWNVDVKIPRGLPGVRPQVKLGKKEKFTELNDETNEYQYPIYNETAILKYNEETDSYSFDANTKKDPNKLPNELWYIEFTCPKRDRNFDTLYQYIDEGPNHIEEIFGTEKYMYILYSSEEYRYEPPAGAIPDSEGFYHDSADRRWKYKDGKYWEVLSGFSINRFGIKTKITTDKLSVDLIDNAETVLEALNKEPVSSEEATQQNPEHINGYYQGKDGNGENGEDVGSQWIQWDQENDSNEIVATNYYYYDSVAQEWRLVLGLDSETVDINIYSGSDPIDNVVAKGFVKENITFENFDWSDIYNE